MLQNELRKVDFLQTIMFKQRHLPRQLLLVIKYDLQTLNGQAVSYISNHKASVQLFLLLLLLTLYFVLVSDAPRTSQIRLRLHLVQHIVQVQLIRVVIGEGNQDPNGLDEGLLQALGLADAGVIVQPVLEETNHLHLHRPQVELQFRLHLALMQLHLEPLDQLAEELLLVREVQVA